MTKPFRRSAVVLALLALGAWGCANPSGPAGAALSVVRIMSFNIRYDTPADGPNAWPHRKDIAAGTIAFHRPAIAGLQEVLVSQLRDLEALLPEYAWVGVGRDDGREAGEFNPVFYLKSRFRRLESSTFWLSETPECPGVKGWDAACARIVTWVRLRDLWTGRVLVAFNTHFDHVGETSRRESAKLVLAAVERIAAGAPVILTGDLNCTREDPAYRTLVAPGPEGPPLLCDVRDIAERPPYGPPASFNGFRAELAEGRPIDHIFVRPGTAVLVAAILPAAMAGRFVSDHNPVVADVRLAPR
jgi:endonuclease/exonuclease/phosphatase family metal-dependent hydrolase